MKVAGSVTACTQSMICGARSVIIVLIPELGVTVALYLILCSVGAHCSYMLLYHHLADDSGCSILTACVRFDLPLQLR